MKTPVIGLLKPLFAWNSHYSVVAAFLTTPPPFRG
jgi:hypothetical protein